MKGFFYILKCNDGSYYYGSTTDIQKRLKYHNFGRVKSTKNKIPVIIIYQEEFTSYRKANQREFQIKSWKSRDRVERLISMACSSSG